MIKVGIRKKLLAVLITMLAPLIGAQRANCESSPKVEIVPSLGHTFYARSVAFSPDGARVISASNDTTLKLWVVATGALIRTFVGHSGLVVSVAFTPDGLRVLSGSHDKTLKLWDTATGSLIRTFKGHLGAVSSVAISRDGSRLISGSNDKTVKLWDATTGAVIRTFTGHSYEVNSVAFSPDGMRVLSGGLAELRLWDVATGTQLRKFEQDLGEIQSVAFSSDGSSVLSGSIYGELTLRDAATGGLIRNFEGGSEPIGSVAFSPNDGHLLSGHWDKTLKLWDTSTGTLIRTFEGHTARVFTGSFSPDGALVISGDQTGALKLWDTATGTSIRNFEGQTESVSSVAFSPDGRRILSGSYDSKLRLWDAATGALIRILEGHSESVYSVAFSTDGRRILSGSFDKTMRLWDAATGALLRTFEGSTAIVEGVNSVAFSPDGSRVVSGSDVLMLWDAATGSLIRSFDSKSWGSVHAVAFAPDGRRLLSGSSDKKLRLWNAQTGALIRTFEGHSEGVLSVAFSPDGSRVLSGSGGDGDLSMTTTAGSLKLWNAATGALIRSFDGQSESVHSVAFSPDGNRLLSGSLDKTVKVWDFRTGALIRTFHGHSRSVTAVAFSPDGARVISGSEDGTIRILDARAASARPGEREWLLASLIGGRGGVDHWLAMTPQGFFASGQQGGRILSLVQGLEVTTIEQIHQSLFSPDLVREGLAADTNGEVAAAATVMNLDKIIASGPAPDVAILPLSGTQIENDLVTVSARITNKGKGIGRIEWRVNGITSGVTNAPTDVGPVYEVKQTLALDAGNNVIEVVAYNERNLLASLPAQTTITFAGTADTVKPKLHVLAIGVNAYLDEGGTRPGSDDIEYFAPLHLAVPDAIAFAAETKKAATGLYADVRIWKALDVEATPSGLDRVVDEIAAEIQPRDTFVLFVAAHGYSLDGRFYLIPQDYQGGLNPSALASRAIGQERLQDWVANRIKAKKAIILLDTCESGALVGGYKHSRTDATSEAALGRLHEATGRPVLTAAAAGQDALEVTKLGHGVFTSALIEALHHGDRNGDGFIQVSELAAYVQERVPELAAGGAARAAFAARGSAGGGQSARFGSREDFVLTRRLQ